MTTFVDGQILTAAELNSINAATATALQTPRAINGVNFDGTSPITVAAAAGTLTGSTLAAGVTASSLTSVGTLSSLAVSGEITPAPASGIAGNTTGNNAAAGSVGAILTATGTAVSLTSSVNANVTSITLPPGDWDVTGSVSFNPAATTVLSQTNGAVTSTSVTFPAVPFYSTIYGSSNPNSALRYPVPTQQFNVTTNTTVYLVANAVFSVSTCTATATIRARRMQ